MDLTCDICGQEPAIGVASSWLGAFSVAYGQLCYESGAEPWWALLGLLMGPEEVVKAPGMWEHFDPAFKRCCEATCERLGKTIDDLLEAAIEADREYVREMEEKTAAISSDPIDVVDVDW